MYATTNRNGCTTPTPTYRRELALLRTFLGTESYSAHAIEAIITHVDSEGTIEGCPELEPGDREAAEGWLETGYEAVPMTSHAWGSPIGQESPRNPLDDTYRTTGDAWYVDAAEYVHAYAMGTGPDEPPYEPTADDLAELEAWSEAVDEGMSFPREMTVQERLEFASAIVRYWVKHERD